VKWTSWQNPLRNRAAHWARQNTVQRSLESWCQRFSGYVCRLTGRAWQCRTSVSCGALKRQWYERQNTCSFRYQWQRLCVVFVTYLAWHCHSYSVSDGRERSKLQEECQSCVLRKVAEMRLIAQLTCCRSGFGLKPLSDSGPDVNLCLLLPKMA